MQLLAIIIISLFVALFAVKVNTCSSGEYYADTHCVLTPEELEGPYYIPYHLMRKDIREEKPGLKLELKFTINDEWCHPLPKVTVDIWQCDSLGYYSGYGLYGPDRNNSLHYDHLEPTDNATFLRGIQLSDANGVVEFVTNFPGWYHHRTIHIHIEVYRSGNLTHTGQIYFTEVLSEKVTRLKPYSEHTSRRYSNEEDVIFVEQFGNETIIMPKQIDEQNLEAGLNAEMYLIVKT